MDTDHTTAPHHRCRIYSLDQIAFWDAIVEADGISDADKIYWLLECCRDQNDKRERAEQRCETLVAQRNTAPR